MSKTTLPYLRKEQLGPRMGARPVRPFILTPDLYYMTDGDTVSVMSGEAGADGSREAFRIRFSSVNAPEKPKRQASDAIFRDIGLDPHKDNPGVMAHEFMKQVTRKRALLIIPQIKDGQPARDRYGRSIAEVILSGKPGPRFDANGATSLEWLLIDQGHGQLMSGRDMPERVPILLDRIQQEFRDADLGAEPAP